MTKVLNISFQGEYGAFSEQAAMAYFGNTCRPVPRVSFRDVFEDVHRKRSHAGIVPIENSLFGSVHQNFDLLQEYPLHIIGEVKLRIRMNLLALPSTPIKSIRDIYSHPQALGQSDKFLRTLKNVTLHQYYDTAGAAKMIATRQLSAAGAIASIQAAKHYNLKVLKKGIETDHRNFTRFIVLSPALAPPQGHAKTSLIFATRHVPGSLVSCLSLFAERGVNILKIESRPFIGKPWEYLFFVDVGMNRRDPDLASAIKELATHTTYLKILGSYDIGKVVH
ncbi:MAG: prephenate dehydratase [Bacteriovoracaceae bacterium]|nr:prephenate dehydratase [Bacteroidota bacterium]